MLASSLGPLNPVTMETPEGARSDSGRLRTPLKWKQPQAEGGTESAAPEEGASDSEHQVWALEGGGAAEKNSLLRDTGSPEQRSGKSFPCWTSRTMKA